MDQPINKQKVIELYKRHMYRDKQGVKTDWKSVVDDYQKWSGEPFKRDKEALRFHIKGMTKKLWEEEYGDKSYKPMQKRGRKPKKENKPKKDLEITADGTQKLLAYVQMSEEEAKDPDFVMRVNGYPPDKWELIRLRVNEWTARNADNDELYNYQIRLDVRPKKADVLTLEDIKKANREYVYKHPVIKPTKTKGNVALEIGLADLHVGSSYFDELFYMTRIVDIANFAKEIKDLEKIYLVWYGDVLHVDNTNKTTTKGTQLEMPMTAFEMFQLAKKIVDFTIREFAFTNLEVIWVQGNHSRIAEYALFDGTSDRWLDNKHISFDVDERRRKAYLYGNQLVGLYHGDMPKKNRFDWLSRDFKSLWGKARFVEQHGGHLHHEAVETKGAIVHRTLTTVKDTDEYEYGLGYHNVSRVVQTFLYHEEKGLRQINYW